MRRACRCSSATGGRCKLTGAGERLVAHTERILADLEEAEAELAALGSGHLRAPADLGVPYRRAVAAGARPWLGSTQEHPHLRVSMIDFEPEEAMPALKTGHLDLVLTYEWDMLPAIEDAGIERTLLLTEPVYLALPSDHRARRPAGAACATWPTTSGSWDATRPRCSTSW